MNCPGCRAPNPDGATRCRACGRELGRRSVGPGSVVASRYELLAVLGSGGMGTVFQAHDRSLDEVVALKVLKGDISADRGMAQRFRSEVKLAWRVRDRNVCGIHEYGEDGELLYISMELVEGRDLKAILRDQGALSWEEAFDVALQTAAGLRAIHEAGVIHRDLKPANITRDASGLIRLMDFGIAKAFGGEGTNGVTLTGQVIGSPEYMSPEQWRGQELDFRSDIYALGVTIYEMFTGHPPFQAENPAALMVKHLQSPPLLHGPQASRIPPALVPVLGRALAKEPAERYSTCRQMLDALRFAREALDSEATDDLAPAAGPGEDEASTALVDRERALALAASARRAAPSGPRPAVHSRYAKLLVPALTRALTHERAMVRAGAAEALARIGPAAAAAAEALSTAASDTDTDVRIAAAAALAQLAAAEEPAAPAASVPEPPSLEPEAPVPSESTGWTVPPPVRPPAPPPSPAPRPPREPAPHRPSVQPSFPITKVVAIACLLAAVAAVVLLVMRPGRTPVVSDNAPIPPATTLTLPAPPTPAVVEPSPLPPATSPPAPQPTAVPIATPVPSPSPSPRPRPTTVAIAPPTTAAPAPPPVTTPPPASVVPEPTPAPVAASSPEAPAVVSPTPAPPPPTADVVVPPQCVRCPPPPFPEIAQRLGLKGRVRLRLDVDEKGNVGRVQVLEGPRELSEGTVKAVKKWTYRPATRNGVPMPYQVERPFDFQ